MTEAPRRTPTLFGPGARVDARLVAEILRKETLGGALLLVAAVIALIWANSPWSAGYESVRGFEFGPDSLKLHLSAVTWAADGLLAIFFFVAGLELKREFVAGDLRDPRVAAVPVAAAVGGVLLPALLYALVTNNTGGASRGWAIPTATDIAFALAVLAVIGTNLPSALRTFLLTLAVVDDLLAIVIIAVFYTTDLSVVPLLAAIAPLAVFTALVQKGRSNWWLLLPLGAATWTLVHASGVHPTVAGVLLAFAVPVVRTPEAGGPGGRGLAEHFEHLFRPLSAGIAVPVFALLSAGVPFQGLTGLRSALTDSVAVGIIVGLVIGKPVGILAATWLVARFTRAALDESLRWIDMGGLSMLAGVGFTVSLLIGELAFGIGTERDSSAKVAVLAGSLASAVIASLVLRGRNGVYRRIGEAEQADPDQADISGLR